MKAAVCYRGGMWRVVRTSGGQFVAVWTSSHL